MEAGPYGFLFYAAVYALEYLSVLGLAFAASKGLPVGSCTTRFFGFSFVSPSPGAKKLKSSRGKG